MNAPIPQSVVQQVTAQDLKALPLIQKWVSFASVSRDSNLPLIDWTQAYLESLGLECHRTYDDTRQKANLWATLPARDGQMLHNGIVLSGHTDVVPVDGQAWDTDPFDPQIRQGKVYARGASDNKGQCFATLTALKAVLELSKNHPVNIKLFIEGEEESGGGKKS